MIVKPLAVMVVVALTLAGAAGCTRAKAKTTPDVPTLDMPPPPPRDVEVNESEPPPPMPLPQEPARNTPTRPRPQPAAPAQQPRSSEPLKIEPPKTEPAPVEPPKPAEEPPRQPAPTLQTTPAVADMEVERSIRATMTRATNDLSRIDYRALNTDARTQYDTAKGFIAQADAALGRKNLEFARTLADKAAALAAQLRPR